VTRVLGAFFAIAATVFVLSISGIDCATTGAPAPSCSEDPTQGGCLPPLNDDNVIDINARRADGGR